MKSDWRRFPYLFHVHTSCTDGDLTVTQYVRFAEKAGARTVLFLDHIQRKPRYDVRRFSVGVKRAGRGTVRTVLGFESKLLPDGSLDINEDCLKRAAVIGIAENAFPGDADLLRDSFLNVVRTYPARWPQITFAWVHPGLWFLGRRLLAERHEGFQQMLAEACQAGVLIERNLKYRLPSSTTIATLPPQSIITGADAHSLYHLKRWAARQRVATARANLQPRSPFGN